MATLLRSIVLAASVAATVAADPTQCSGHPDTGCGVPNWDIRWDMAASGYVYCCAYEPVYIGYNADQY